MAIGLAESTQDISRAGSVATDLIAGNTEFDKRGKTGSKGGATDATQNVDQRFANKSAEELLEMYRNLESHSGRLASQLGQTQTQLSEALALAKRERDLQQNTSTNGSPAVDAMKLLENPQAALDQYLSSHKSPETEELRTRLNTLESQLGQARFNARHADAASIVGNSDFQAFVRATALRQELLGRAQKNDWGAADALLTEYKDRVAGSKIETSSVDAARRVSLETSRSGSDGGSRVTGKRYKRAEIMALRVNDPETYERSDVQAELLRAYREGRVED